MNDNRAAIQPCVKPGHATAEDGYVLLEGPDGVAVTMTADAAAQTAESLRDAAVQARQQRSTAFGPSDGKTGP